MNKKMHLKSLPFKKIRSWFKTIELRVNDQKRQNFRTHDIIEFWNEEAWSIYRKITKLECYSNFEELLYHVDQKKLWTTDIDALWERLNKYYTLEKQNMYGVVAIHLGNIEK